MGIVYFDTETTSFNPGQICELSLIVEDEGIIKLAKNYFFAVDKMDAGAQETHGFSKELLDELSGGHRFQDYKDELLPIFTENTLVAHNLPFDEKFLSSEFWRCGISFKPIGRLDTMTYFRDIMKIPAKYKKYGPYKNPKLSEVVDYLGIKVDVLQRYTDHLFGASDTSFHDSRYDTAILNVVTNIWREKTNGGCNWHNTFC